MLYVVAWFFMKALLRLTFALLGGIRRSGGENVPRTGGVLICPNHVSDADPPAVAVTLPRNAYFMAKAELFAVPILGKLLKIFHAFPIKRDSADRAALRRAEELLKAGQAVVIFPEGGGNAEGTLQPLHPGAMLIALRTRVPVIPVALVNTPQMWTYGAPLPQRSGTPVEVTYGPPLDLSDLYGARGGAEEATRRLTETLATMLGQSIPAGKPRNRTEEEADQRSQIVPAPGASMAPSTKFSGNNTVPGLLQR